MEDLVIYKHGEPVGVTAPSTVYGRLGGTTQVNGPKGISQLSTETEASLLAALEQSGALIPGSAEEIATVQSLIADPVTSRTASYLLCTSDSCRDFIGKIKTLHNAHVILLGCGGIGCSIAMLLAGAGIRKLTLIDPDRIEASNLNRQLFWELSDIGKLKVDTLKVALLKRFENIEIHVSSEAMDIARLAEVAMNSCEGVAVTADDPGTLAWEARWIAKSCNIPVVSGGYFHHHCIANLFSPKAEYHANEGIDEWPEWKRLPNSIMPSYGPTNMALASILCSSLIASIIGDQPEAHAIVRWDSSAHPYEPRLVG
jgi:hypothetical protein